MYPCLNRNRWKKGRKEGRKEGVACSTHTYISNNDYILIQAKKWGAASPVTRPLSLVSTLHALQTRHVSRPPKPCIRLTRLKFELTNQDSTSERNSDVLMTFSRYCIRHEIRAQMILQVPDQTIDEELKFYGKLNLLRFLFSR